MAAPRTLKVVTSLREAGIEIWTPVEERKRRAPRSKARATGSVQHPIAPTFAFARAEHVTELRAIRRDPLSPHPSFSLLQHRGVIVEIKDSDLAGLRAAEHAAKPKTGTARKERPAAISVGSRLKVENGPFGGMSGIVTRSDGRRTFLDFGGLLGRVEITTNELPSEWLMTA